MCGIFGLAFVPAQGLERKSAEVLLARLLHYSESRGKEAAGVAFLLNDRIAVHRDSAPPSAMTRTKEYRDFHSRCFDDAFAAAGGTSSPVAIIGHSRLVTNGLQGILSNNQPVITDPIVLVHNGIVVNTDSLMRQFELPPRQTDVDSEIIGLLIVELLRRGMTLPDATHGMLSALKGEASVAILAADSSALTLATNTGSIYWTSSPRAFAFASEQYILERSLEAIADNDLGAARISQVRPGFVVTYDLATSSIREFAPPAGGRTQAPEIAITLAATRRIEDSLRQTAQLRSTLRRCTRCILPESMPYIRFNSQGICNYCENYRKQSLRGLSDLERQLSAHRKNDGRADCLVAFSGGRDSSYGLHVLKREFGMTPVAFTYDWGMVTDLARRNQARICGQLGIEHLWVSADIKAKRANIRRNLLAWMRRPSLGMVPLLMAGDKHFFWLANKIMKQMNIRLMVWCMNDLERTDFKTGFAGIPPVWTSQRHYRLSLARTARIAAYYGSQYLLNPAYLNRSLLDSLTAFASYYLVSQDYAFLYDYVPWREEELERVLLEEYDWETAEDTKSTWRIGDGTAPFYNFVYYTVAGLTEHDTFRSNQIREGQISRSRALSLAERDNVPRWSAIRDYLSLINVDFDDVIRVVERMPKLYDSSVRTARSPADAAH